MSVKAAKGDHVADEEGLGVVTQRCLQETFRRHQCNMGVSRMSSGGGSAGWNGLEAIMVEDVQCSDVDSVVFVLCSTIMDPNRDSVIGQQA